MRAVTDLTRSKAMELYGLLVVGRWGMARKKIDLVQSRSPA